MDFHLAFDKNADLEFLVYKHMYYDKDKNVYFSSFKSNQLINLIGTFLLIFLNTDFEDIEDCQSFIFWFCFESIYYRKHPKSKAEKSTQLVLSYSEFHKELKTLAEENKEDFIYLKNTLLKNLRLPYDPDFFRKYDRELGYSKEDINRKIQEEKEYYEDKTKKYDDIAINGFIEDIKINFETIPLLFHNINPYKYNIPYYFYGEDILGIIALIFKEFMADDHNTIRQCQNCGKYFVPSNLKETKYCNADFEDTGKTCRQIGKELAYKKSLQEDKLLDKYRKRYMTLASSVSHYGTDSSIARFKKYKLDGAIMKKKYLSKEITAKEFEKWINSTKNN